jgi:hypothetical protein
LKQNWATFVKARLNCSLNTDYTFYFDQIRRCCLVCIKYTLRAESVYKTSDAADKVLFYATFTTGSQSEYTGSAVCSYALDDIDKLFDTGTFKGTVQ